MKAAFDGGRISSDAGVLLLRELEQQTGIVQSFADCFVDHRDPGLIEHSVYELLLQRIGALALGYEDLLDHDTLRHDPPLALFVGKADPMGAESHKNQREASASDKRYGDSNGAGDQRRSSLAPEQFWIQFKSYQEDEQHYPNRFRLCDAKNPLLYSTLSSRQFLYF